MSCDDSDPWTNDRFLRVQRLALRLAGIELVERHRGLLDRRSHRMGVRDGPGLDAWLGAVEQGDADASRRLIGLITTGFTGFFRHSEHFDVAARHALRAARGRGFVRLWSAAAATGEEPYSLAMALVEACRSEAPPVTILATDIHDEALLAARRGEYGEAAMAALEAGRRDRFFARISAGRWGIAPSLRGLVDFRPLNLASSEWPVEGPIDVILCRNVLMYLEAGQRLAVVERMASLLAPDGLLILDPAEHLGGAQPLFTAGAGGVHSLRHASCPKRAPSRAPCPSRP